MRPLAWDSSAPGVPWTVTQKMEVMGVLAAEKMASGAVESPGRRRMVGEREARDWARGEEGSRVRARILGGGDGDERRAFMTEVPWVPVAPMMRNVWVAILILQNCLLWI